jgi:hypothetical protein
VLPPYKGRGAHQKRCDECKKANRSAYDKERWVNNHEYRARHTALSNAWKQRNKERVRHNKHEWRKRTNAWQRRGKPLKMAQEESRETGVPVELVLKLWGFENGGLLGKRNARMGGQNRRLSDPGAGEKKSLCEV